MTDGVFDTSLFGTPDQVGVVRGLAEIRARRPVLVTANSETLLALPVDGIDSSRLTAFKNFCLPHRPKLILSARRARWLGFQTSAPMALTVAAGTDVEQLLELVVDSEVDHAPDGEPAGVAAVAAIQVVKLAQGLPAVLATRASCHVRSSIRCSWRLRHQRFKIAAQISSARSRSLVRYECRSTQERKRVS